MGLSSLFKGLFSHSEPPQPDSPTLPSMRELLAGYRVEAQRYYASPRYVQGVAEIHNVFQKIRGRVIAVDLDGTLLSTFMGRRTWKERYRIDDVDRVVRPFAKEFLQAIDDSENYGLLWTGMPRARFNLMRSGIPDLQIPPSFGVLTGEDYLALLKDHPDYTGLFERTAGYSGLEAKLKKGLVKIPAWVSYDGQPVDGLVDDNADVDGQALKLLGLGDQVPRLFPVSSFSFWCGGEREPGDVEDDVDGLSRYFEDEGLLRVAREIRERWKAAGI